MKTFEDSYTQVYMDTMYPQPEPIQLASGPSATMSDAAPAGAGSISAIPQTTFEKLLEQTGLTLEQVGMELDKLGKVSIGGFEIGIRDFLPFVGSSEKDIDPATGQEIIKQVGTPETLKKLGTGVGPMLDRVSRGTGFARQLDQDAKLSLFDLPTIGAALKPAAKAGRKAVQVTKDLPAGLSIKDVSANYRGLHTAPSKGEGAAPANDLTKIYPDDVYGSMGAQYYGHYGQNNRLDVSTLNILRGVRGNPDADITVYRAVPTDLFSPKINPGDWVTVNRAYAKEHGESVLEGKYKIVSKKVKAKDIHTDGNSIHEWGYDPVPKEQK